MYQVQLVSTEHSQDAVGQVTVDASANTGAVNVTISQGIANSNLFLTFCQFGHQNQNCILVGSFSTDARGNADANLQFPEKGTFVGVFYVSPTNDTTDPSVHSFYQTEPASFGGNFGANSQSYRASLQPENNVTGGLQGIPTTAEPLSSGFITEVGSTLHVEVHGARPDSQYDVSFCPNSTFGSGCSSYSPGFMTDASGNGTVDLQTASGPTEIFFVELQGTTRGQGYVTGFIVQ